MRIRPVKISAVITVIIAIVSLVLGFSIRSGRVIQIMIVTITTLHTNVAISRPFSVVSILTARGTASVKSQIKEIR